MKACAGGNRLLLSLVFTFLAVLAQPFDGRTAGRAQLRVQPVGELPGEVALRLMLRKLKNVGTFMQMTAHPDDEDNALLAMLAHGEGIRTVLVSATRGEGGQNEIGPELFDALSVLRTAELESVHRFDGAEQYFTRAVDFGFSFSVDESIRKWGRDEIVGDYVRHIRAARPHVVAAFVCGGDGGGQHHQASTVLSLDAVAAAADPRRYPEHLREGLRPWQVLRAFCTEGFNTKAPLGPGQLAVADATFDPLIGRTYGELGTEARSMHKCQGTSQLLPLPDQSVSRVYRVRHEVAGLRGPGAEVRDPVSANGTTASMFDGIPTSLSSLAAGDAKARWVLQQIEQAVAAAETSLARGGLTAAAAPLAAGLRLTRDLRRTAQDDLAFRLEQKEAQFEAALALSHGLRVEALANDGVVFAGQPVRVSLHASAGSSEPVVIREVTVAGFDGAPPSCTGAVKAGAPLSCQADMTVSRAKLSSPYWHAGTEGGRYEFEPEAPFGVPFSPTPFRATFAMDIAGERVTIDRAVEFRYDNMFAGEKRMELQVVPQFGVTVSPAIVVIPDSAASRGASRSVRVTVSNNTKGAADTMIELRAAAGWTVTPSRAPVKFAREDESITVTFAVTPPTSITPGEYPLRAVHGAAAIAADGYQVIDYPHIRRRHIVRPARAHLKVIDVAIAAKLRVGYVMGVGDQVPEAIEQLGAIVELIGPEALSSGNLSKYDVVVTGVRAYERRADLRANNHRLIAYVESGGTVLVQYNKFEFNQAQYGPYPAKVSANRITDENAPVEVLVPEHPVFNRPNRIDASAWSGWVQERGLYFLGDRDPRYTDLVRMTDPFPFNAGPKTGALVEAKVGRGRWIYVGLGLWRQLPAGTPGAYRLMANLLSLGRAAKRP